MVRLLNADFQKEARKDKESYWEKQCNILETDFAKGQTRNAFAQVKRIRAPFIPRKGEIKDKEGKDIIDKQGILSRWHQYGKDLYNNSNNSQHTLCKKHFKAINK